MIPPFIDTIALQSLTSRRRMPPRLVTVAMMRPGDKLESYRPARAAALGGSPGSALDLDDCR